jgi:hypothetical protein
VVVGEVTRQVLDVPEPRLVATDHVAHRVDRATSSTSSRFVCSLCSPRCSPRSETPRPIRHAEHTDPWQRLTNQEVIRNNQRLGASVALSGLPLDRSDALNACR